jgi:hypothetical protein
MVDIGNGVFCDFHEAAENHFQPMWWKCKKSRETAISRFPRSFPRTWRQEWHVDMANDWSVTLGKGAICGGGVPAHLIGGSQFRLRAGDNASPALPQSRRLPPCRASDAGGAAAGRD